MANTTMTKSGEVMQQIGVQLNMKTLEEIDKLARKSNQKRTAILRKLLTLGLEQSSDNMAKRLLKLFTTQARDRLFAIAHESNRTEIAVLEHLLSFVDTRENLEIARAADVVLQGRCVALQAQVDELRSAYAQKLQTLQAQLSAAEIALATIQTALIERSAAVQPGGSGT